VWQKCRSHWPRGLRRRSAAARLLRSWVRIPPGAWIFVCFECCVLSGRRLCDELIAHPEESYRLCCVVVCDLETSWMRRPWPTGGYFAKNKQTNKQTIWQKCHRKQWSLLSSQQYQSKAHSDYVRVYCNLSVTNFCPIMRSPYLDYCSYILFAVSRKAL